LIARTSTEFHRDVEGMIDAGGDQVVVSFHLRGTARVSGVSVDEHMTTVVGLRQGRLHRIVVFRDRAAALEAAGLSA
jgi:ketosteroid isomerase-like protein